MTHPIEKEFVRFGNVFLTILARIPLSDPADGHKVTAELAEKSFEDLAGAIRFLDFITDMQQAYKNIVANSLKVKIIKDPVAYAVWQLEQKP